MRRKYSRWNIRIASMDGNCDKHLKGGTPFLKRPAAEGPYGRERVIRPARS